MGDLVNARRYVPQPALGTDIVKICREKPRKLFDKVIDRANPAV